MPKRSPKSKSKVQAILDLMPGEGGAPSDISSIASLLTPGVGDASPADWLGALAGDERALLEAAVHANRQRSVTSLLTSAAGDTAPADWLGALAGDDAKAAAVRTRLAEGLGMGKASRGIFDTVKGQHAAARAARAALDPDMGRAARAVADEVAAVGTPVAADAAGIALKGGKLAALGRLAGRALPGVGIALGLLALYQMTLGARQERRHNAATDLLGAATGDGSDLAERAYGKMLGEVAPGAASTMLSAADAQNQNEAALGELLARNAPTLRSAAHVSTPSFEEYMLQVRAAQAARMGGGM